MVNTMISIPGYVHLYRSLLRFYDMPENEVREMLYLLNTANLDCYEYYHPDRSVIQSGPVAMIREVRNWHFPRMYMIKHLWLQSGWLRMNVDMLFSMRLTMCH